VRSAAAQLRPESVIHVTGRVRRRVSRSAAEARNDVEIEVLEMHQLSSRPSIPDHFSSVLQKDLSLPSSPSSPSAPQGLNDESRLRYRVLDLRTPRMQRNLRIRSRAVSSIRSIFDCM
jgi:aspartyl-tRNA synthetase